MSEKIKITIGDACIEIEGSGKYVDQKLQNPSTFDGLISALSGVEKATIKGGGAAKKTKTAAKGKSSKTKVTTRKKVGYAIVKDLDLKQSGDKPSLKEFYDKMKPFSCYEKNLVFIYYLEKIKNDNNISLNHIFTCYRDIPTKVPKHLDQSIWDGASRKGWYESSDNKIVITVVGENVILHDMPEKAQKAQKAQKAK